MVFRAETGWVGMWKAKRRKEERTACLLQMLLGTVHSTAL